jgi:hypothetical protein
MNVFPGGGSYLKRTTRFQDTAENGATVEGYRILAKGKF